MTATTPVIVVCGVRARHVLAKAAGACDSNAAAGSLGVSGDGDRVAGGVGGAGEVTAGPGVVAAGDGALLDKMLPRVTRSFCGTRKKMAKAARPSRAVLATIEDTASARRGPRRCRRVSFAETSLTWAFVARLRRARKAYACPGADWPAKLSRLRYRLVR